MRVFCSDISACLSGGAKYRRDESGALARALLAYALRAEYKLALLPQIVLTDTGKPYFPERPDIHFSLSHSGRYVLCALSSSPVGCDIETLRPIGQRVMERVMGQGEIARFKERGSRAEDFFKLWTLKESAVKVSGDTSLSFRDLCFTLDPAASEDGRYRCAVYESVPGCAVAVCSLDDKPAGEIVMVNAGELAPFRPART